MPRICSFYGIVIWMYWDDHDPPHFHATYGEFEILIRISDLSVYTGELPSRAFGMLMEWASQHQLELMENRQIMRQNLPIKKIEPLK